MPTTRTSSGVPLIDFSTLGELGDVYNRGKVIAARRKLGQAFKDGEIDYGAGARILAESGDMEGALSFAKLGEAAGYRAEDRAWRQQEASRAQSNADRMFAAQQDERSRPSIAWQEDETGRKVPYAVDARSGVVRAVDVPGQVARTSAREGNPFSTGKMTETQSKDAVYATRMMDSEVVLSDPAVLSASNDIVQGTLGQVPKVGNYLITPERRQAVQAQRNFINATLRRESGAVISASEFENARLQYFPQPGDDPGTLEQKRKNRIEAIRGFAAGAGPSYRPQYILDQENRLVRNPGSGLEQAITAPAAAKPQAQPPASAPASGGASRAAPFNFSKQQVIDEARAAMQPNPDGRRRDPALIAKKLRELGVDPREAGIEE